MNILVINAGSSSLKYQLINKNDDTVLAKGVIGRIGEDSDINGTVFDGRSFSKQVDAPDHIAAFNVVKNVLIDGEYKVIDSFDEISAVGHRVVQGGSLYTKSVLIDDEVIKGIESLNRLAPLHNPAHVQGINACRATLGEDIPQVAVFDNAFHSTMPPEAYMYAIPYEYYEKYKIRRYGFHGTSHKYISQKLADAMGRDIKELKLVTCHIGNGASVTAVKYGKVIDTSMGFTPLDGFMMGTRSGNLDPSVVTFIAREEKLNIDEIEALLNKESGVYGISGASSDDRDITRLEAEGDERAHLAHLMQAYQIKRYIGSYVAAMNGVDGIVFTGGVGENGRKLREYICTGLTCLGFKFDFEVNETLYHGKEGEITKPGSRVRIFVLTTNEELMIANETEEIVRNLS